MLCVSSQFRGKLRNLFAEANQGVVTPVSFKVRSYVMAVTLVIVGMIMPKLPLTAVNDEGEHHGGYHECQVEFLKKEFGMKDLGKTKFYLGLQIEHLKDRIFIHQSTYT